MNKEIRLSVHQLVDFLLRSGDIDNRIFNRASMNEGSALHASFQAKQDNSYLSEYPLKHTFNVETFSVTLEGRADGIIRKSDKDYIVDEIKTTVADLNEFKDQNLEWHLGQAKCYAYMFAKEKDLDDISIRLTYIRQGEEKEKMFLNYSFYTSDLEQYIYGLLEDYLAFYHIQLSRLEKRNQTIKEMAFPFSHYRKGQRELAKYVYSISKSGGSLFCEAPTGIGKTISTLFPTIKALIEDEEAKIFYLTAKTSGKESAHDAIQLLQSKNLFISDIVITAKDKICFCKGKACNPDECPYTKGYYNKVQSVIKYALLNGNDFDLKTITSLAYDNQICPFEFELDLSLFVDVIICDYNYLFDPTSYMKRYFDEDASHHFALIDEAHNLVDRSRDMYSATFHEETYLLAKKSCTYINNKKLKTVLSKLGKLFKTLKENEPAGISILPDFSDDVYKILNSFTNTYTDLSKNYNKDITPEFTDLFLEINRFLKISDFVSERYLVYFDNSQRAVLHLFCLDASRFLRNSCHQIKASTFFSATLSPTAYFVDTLGGDQASNAVLKLSSPFPKENLRMIIAPKISVKYKNREGSYEQVGEYIYSFIKNKTGNYIVYVPSYDYLNRLKEALPHQEEYHLLLQKTEMSDSEKKDFLAEFTHEPKVTTLGLAVMGGTFGEGVDLVSDRLIGVVIVGIGLPKINFESDKIAEYYTKQGQSGYLYAYLYPGMNKVTQAVGRVIRSENDRGIVLLIDERYLTNEYRDLFKADWSDYRIAFSKEEVEAETKDFFKN